MGEKVLPVYSLYKTTVDGEDRCIYAPFRSRIDWEVARWAKMRGPGSNAGSELLGIDGLADALGLSFKNMSELNKIIDGHLPAGRPRFKRREIVVQGEAFEVYYRDVLECIRALFGDPEFAQDLLLVPERHYTDASRQTRVYFDMNTGDWWWRIQRLLDRHSPGGTVVPIIISSDKTQLTVFGNKTAYPVYLTIGNLPKDIRRKPSHRGQVLLAYLPTSNLEHITNQSSRRRTLLNLFHACMRHILAPLQSAGEHGVTMARGDGVMFRCHPVLAAYVGDYPEQVLVACCKKGDCPKCPIPRDELGNSTDTECAIRDIKKVLDALDTFDDGPTAYNNACENAGIKPVIGPFWKELPYVDIYASITPDILHQLYQGVMKHLISWIKSAYGPVELDARCRRMPPNHHLRHFSKGISKLQRVTGKEHADICRVLLGLIIELPLLEGFSPSRLVRAARALLDFLYVAQYPVHTSATVSLLRDALAQFHANKSIFVDLGIRLDFHFPKLHGLDHYILSIRLFGSPDNFDTQYTERLHIEFAKDAYRATNRKDEFSQMTLWLERREKVQRHEAFIRWRLSGEPLLELSSGDLSGPSKQSLSVPSPLTLSGPQHHNPVPPTESRMLSTLLMAKHPSVKGVPISKLIQDYGATIFRVALARFVVQYRHPTWSRRQVEHAATAVYLTFNTVPVYHKAKFLLADVHGSQMGVATSIITDVVHARPARTGKYRQLVPGRFDTAFINCGDGDRWRGYCVGQVRVIFEIPKRAVADLFPDVTSPKHLAYIDWFTPFQQPHPVHGMYKVSHDVDRTGSQMASIVELRHIRRSCHLFPSFGPTAPREWTSSNVLERSPYFWVNPFTDRFTYATVY
ncbi:hypothetical protein BN946_scf185040.g7 [Trametes cinnabarina]|uniref:Uncharacterized protein n=1 Tax=Pycnoporus cinnabarinus TaxID=5643 RepID=A0A060SAT9_PYCCI|nr:hypothetical protein BN946_scf185040.g7 [Trametes cinnabarina]